jgi:hypothetical protein
MFFVYASSLFFALILYHLYFRNSAAFDIPLIFCRRCRHGGVRSGVETTVSKLSCVCVDGQ